MVRVASPQNLLRFELKIMKVRTMSKTMFALSFTILLRWHKTRILRDSALLADKFKKISFLVFYSIISSKHFDGVRKLGLNPYGQGH